VPIVASDVSFRMVDFARRNAERAGVAQWIEFHGGDALERPAPALPVDLPGTLILNPPYGERIQVAGKAGAAAVERTTRASAEDRDLPPDFFARLSAHWKRAYTQHPAGWTAFVLSPDMKLPGAMRLKESMRMPMWNGPIECRLFRFALVAGSARG
jgi:putative N6-adenine-specific DNA methylase